MLDVFRGKLTTTPLRAELLVADGNGQWPVEDGRIDMAFSAHALHHLDPVHVLAEVARVLSPAGGSPSPLCSRCSGC